MQRLAGPGFGRRSNVDYGAATEQNLVYSSASDCCVFPQVTGSKSNVAGFPGLPAQLLQRLDQLRQTLLQTTDSFRTRAPKAGRSGTAGGASRDCGKIGQIRKKGRLQHLHAEGELLLPEPFQRRGSPCTTLPGTRAKARTRSSAGHTRGTHTSASLSAGRGLEHRRSPQSAY